MLRERPLAKGPLEVVAMKKFVWFAVLSLLLVSFSGNVMAVERDYRLFLTDGSWVRTAGNPELVDGKAKVRLPAGQLVVFPEGKVDWDRTHEWNDVARDAKITTALPLPKSVLRSPVVVGHNLETLDGVENLSAGDPRDRLNARIKELEVQEAEVARQRDQVRKQILATEDQEQRRKLGARLTELDDEFRALRTKKNGLALELNNWQQ
jgi:hypothetical protein